MKFYNVFLVLSCIFFSYCKVVDYRYEDNLQKVIPSDIKSHYILDDDSSLVEFTSIFINDSISISQNEKHIFSGSINTSELLGIAKTLIIKQKDTEIFFFDRGFKLDLKAMDLKKYKFVYISCVPDKDTSDWITKETLKKSKYVVEYSNDYRTYR